jgi:hypothetical protein
VADGSSRIAFAEWRLPEHVEERARELPREAREGRVGAFQSKEEALRICLCRSHCAEGAVLMGEGAKRSQRVAVYCGSADGNSPAFRAEATALGSAIAGAGLGLVYGGSCIGLMGAVADAALAGGAEVVGVLPAVLAEKEIEHTGLTVLDYVPTMHERKARMVDLADAFLILPGGYGTLDELMEAVTWAQLRMHDKPCILVNSTGYWDGLLRFLDTAVEAGFVRPENRMLLRVASSVDAAVAMAAEAVGEMSSARRGIPA